MPARDKPVRESAVKAAAEAERARLEQELAKRAEKDLAARAREEARREREEATRRKEQAQREQEEARKRKKDEADRDALVNAETEIVEALCDVPTEIFQASHLKILVLLLKPDTPAAAFGQILCKLRHMAEESCGRAADVVAAGAIPALVQLLGLEQETEASRGSGRSRSPVCALAADCLAECVTRPVSGKPGHIMVDMETASAAVSAGALAPLVSMLLKGPRHWHGAINAVHAITAWGQLFQVEFRSAGGIAPLTAVLGHAHIHWGSKYRAASVLLGFAKAGAVYQDCILQELPDGLLDDDDRLDEVDTLLGQLVPAALRKAELTDGKEKMALQLIIDRAAAVSLPQACCSRTPVIRELGHPSRSCSEHS